MKNKNISLFLLACLMFVSCGDFLEPKSNTEYTPDDVESLNEMLLGVAYPQFNAQQYWCFLSCLDDDVTARPWISTTTATPGVSDYESSSQIRGIKVFYTWTENYDFTLSEMGITAINRNIYATLYKYITGVNATLDYADQMSISTPEGLLNVKAQAYTLRAFHYFHLTNVYGTPYNSHPQGLGVPLKLTSKVEKEPLTRNTVKECYDQIVSDLLAAEECYVGMGDSHQWKNNFRTSLAMARLMLSRVYLYMENWEEAAKYAKLVMEDPTFSLLNLNDYPIPTTAGLTPVPYTNFISYASPETIWLYGNIQEGFNTTLVSPTTSSTVNKPRLFNASGSLLGAFTEKTATGSDLRYDHYIVREIDDRPTYSLKRAFGKVAISGMRESNPWEPVQRGGAETTFGRALRLSEAYLNYAEAIAMMAKEGKPGGDAALAMAAINELRINRIKTTDYTALSAADFAGTDGVIEFIRNERRRELCFEGHRWFDLRRWGMPEITHTWEQVQGNVEVYTLPAQGKFYAIPLPTAILEANSSLDPNTWKN